jgi:glycosyltransferase involved in cell wall biosynthesis
MKIAYLTSVHPRTDTRVYEKMCKKMSEKNEVYLFCADGLGNEIKKNLSIYDFGKSNSRFERIWNKCNIIYDKSLKINADIYHLHDPELIRIGLKLIKKGKKVIFDSHEDVSQQILDKRYLDPISRFVISKCYSLYENFSLKKFNGIIAATPYIRNKLKKINSNIIDVCNYPTIPRTIGTNIKHSNNSNPINICYIGTISKTRGIINLIKSLELVQHNVVLNLAGYFSPKLLEKEAKCLVGWKKVKWHGFVNKHKFFKKTNNIIGMVNLLKTPNHINSLPTKMFEYMSHKIPVLASNIPLWKKIIKSDNCGITCNPEDPSDIAKKIDYLINNKILMTKFSKNGYRACVNKYNWEFEYKKLINFYKKIYEN